METKLVQSIVSLNVLYNTMPKTFGCDKCEEHNKENKQWCCKKNSPSMYYVEFANVWDDVQKWEKDKKLSLLLRVYKNYLNTELEKPCVFYNNGCECYNKRPLACRLYGIFSHESWQKKTKNLKEKFGNDYKIHPQCHLVKTFTGDKLPIEREDCLYNMVKIYERQAGIPQYKVNLHDEPEGCYRTFHDHILIEQGDSEIMEFLNLFKIKKPNEEQIDSFVETLKTVLEAQDAI